MLACGNAQMHQTVCGSVESGHRDKQTIVHDRLGKISQQPCEDHILSLMWSSDFSKMLAYSIFRIAYRQEISTVTIFFHHHHMDGVTWPIKLNNFMVLSVEQVCVMGSRREQEGWTRMRIGHTGLNSTLKVRGGHDSGSCEGCLVETEHVLLHCVWYYVDR